MLAYTPYISRGSARRREIALTFDDGPGPYTAHLLRQLRRLRAPATFFYVGQQLRYWGPALRSELKHGFAVANHTENHPMLRHLNARAQRSQILKATKAAAGWGAPPPRLFRPPYGSYDATTLKLLRRMRMLMVLWTTDTGDFRRPGTKVIVQTALRGARPGAIILMHDAGGIRDQTIVALPPTVTDCALVVKTRTGPAVIMTLLDAPEAGVRVAVKLPRPGDLIGDEILPADDNRLGRNDGLGRGRGKVCGGL